MSESDRITISRQDADAIMRLIEGQSLPLDMEPWRAGLLRRLNTALDRVAALNRLHDSLGLPDPVPESPLGPAHWTETLKDMQIAGLMTFLRRVADYSNDAWLAQEALMFLGEATP